MQYTYTPAFIPTLNIYKLCKAEGYVDYLTLREREGELRIFEKEFVSSIGASSSWDKPGRDSKLLI